MTVFSERNGYITPSSVLIREDMPEEIKNAICTGYDLLLQAMLPRHGLPYEEMEKYLWCHFLKKRLINFYVERGHHSVATPFIESNEHPWYRKLDLIEETIAYFSDQSQGNYDSYNRCRQFLVDYLNSAFKRLNYAYRIIDDQIVEVTSEEEIAEIETALQNSSNGVREHLHTALELLSIRPEGDYRNSIKESISAVEHIVREITGENSFNLSKLERKIGGLNSQLKEAYQNLYNYTNHKSTGIRHPLMDDANAPKAEEAIFMLISCSAFINYLTKKKA